MKQRVLAVTAATMFSVEMAKILTSQILDLIKALVERYHELVRIFS